MIKKIVINLAYYWGFVPIKQKKVQDSELIELCFKEESERVKLISEDLYDSDMLKSEWRDSLRRVKYKLMYRIVSEVKA
jgi:hypothetical protein